MQRCGVTDWNKQLYYLTVFSVAWLEVSTFQYNVAFPGPELRPVQVQYYYDNDKDIFKVQTIILNLKE